MKKLVASSTAMLCIFHRRMWYWRVEMCSNCMDSYWYQSCCSMSSKLQEIVEIALAHGVDLKPLTSTWNVLRPKLICWICSICDCVILNVYLLGHYELYTTSRCLLTTVRVMLRYIHLVNPTAWLLSGKMLLKQQDFHVVSYNISG